MSFLGKVAGQRAEARVANEAREAGWQIRQSPLLDYGEKIDLQTVCPGRKPFSLQVSVGIKSVGANERLAERGVIPLAITVLDASGLIAPEYLCENYCERVLCSDRLSPVTE